MECDDFTYLITVHNKEALLERVLSGVGACAGSDARIVIVLDGCSDGSETIARRFAATAGIETRVVTAPDVHEIKSINIGFRQVKSGYCVIVQDDVIVEERRLESLVRDLHERYGRRLGYLSFRLAADVRPVAILRRYWATLRLGRMGWLAGAELYRLIGGPREQLDVQRIKIGVFSERMVGIKSPVCLTPELRHHEPWLDEDLAPYCYDDVDLSLRALKHGLTNGLFPIEFRSEKEWGGTRLDPEFSSVKGSVIRLRNRGLIWTKHFGTIRSLSGRRRNGEGGR